MGNTNVSYTRLQAISFPRQQFALGYIDLGNDEIAVTHQRNVIFTVWNQLHPSIPECFTDIDLVIGKPQKAPVVDFE